MAVVDASVCVALFVPSDSHHLRAKLWLSSARESAEPIIAPAVLPAEIGAAIARGLDDDRLALRAVKELWQGALIELVAISLDLARSASDLAIRLRIRGCDALYVALAAESRQKLITFDRQQLERAGSLVAAIEP